MESPLDELPSSDNDLLTVGAMYARDVDALCNDIAAMIFPTAITPPTEETISAVTGKLIVLVADIESALRAESKVAPPGIPKTWQLLAQSGFLREPALIDYILARVAEDHLDAKLSKRSNQLSGRLLDHAEPNIAHATQALLAADSLHRRAKGLSHKALRPELLHQLCWRIVAAIEVTDGLRDPAVLTNARSLLADYDEAATAQVAAQKLVHFLGGTADSELADPDNAGLQLYVAQCAKLLGLDADHVLHLMDSTSVAPFAVMLRAAGNNAEQAMAAIFAFKEFSLKPRDIALFENGFDLLEPKVALAEVGRWAIARSQYLMLPQTKQSVQR